MLSIGIKDWYLGATLCALPAEAILPAEPASVLLPGGVGVGRLTSVWYEAQVISV